MIRRSVAPPSSLEESGFPAEVEAVIVGGGLAGLAAGMRLAEAGTPPLLLESAPKVGGRIGAILADSGEELDLAPHLLLGGCVETLAMMERLETRSHLRAARGAALITDEGVSRLVLPPWPPPLHLLGGIGGMSGLTLPDLAAALRLGWRLARKRPPAPDETVHHWLDSLGQTPTLRRLIWDPLCLAVTNRPPAASPAAPFAEALRRIFLDSSDGATPLLPQAPWFRLLAQPAARWIEARGGRVITRLRSLAPLLEGNRVIGVTTPHGPIRARRGVIVALPPEALARWAPNHFAPPPSSPIVSVHLTYPVAGPAFAPPEPLIGLPGRPAQWLLPRPTPPDVVESRWSAALSGAYAEIHWSDQRLLEAVHDGVGRAIPALRDATPRLVRTTRVRRAISAPPVGQVPPPPGPVAGLPGLFLAGDWTSTGLPATMEGAVVSGRKAAEALLKG